MTGRPLQRLVRLAGAAENASKPHNGNDDRSRGAKLQPPCSRSAKLQPAWSASARPTRFAACKPNDKAQQRRGTGELWVEETNHAPPSAAAPGSASAATQSGADCSRTECRYVANPA